MAHYSEQLAAAVRETLALKGKSARDVARTADGRISHMTINEMMRGVVPSPKKIAAFAIAVGEHPDPFLEAAGEPFRYTGELTLSSVMRGPLTAAAAVGGYG